MKREKMGRLLVFWVLVILVLVGVCWIETSTDMIWTYVVAMSVVNGCMYILVLLLGGERWKMK
uniref:Uncharacterized protein n=1 Tax=candidate division CPR3 bacterium TaxID=2268181 RepID=A0A7V3J9N6_UNCC3